MAALPPKPTKWTDQEWIAALMAGHDEAWARLRDTIHRGLSVYVHEQARDPDQAAFVKGLVEDATQEALLAVRGKLDTFRGESRFTTWVYRVAVNVLLGLFRRRRWEAREQTLSPALPDWPLDEQAPSPARAAQIREIWEFVRRVIDDELTPHQRTVLLAHVFTEKPLDLVAADLGISRDAAYKAIHDARRKLRTALLARGLTLDRTRDIFGG
jgi:RNA polymerase sigma-70 factor (ECF subfamily)